MYYYQFFEFLFEYSMAYIDIYLLLSVFERFSNCMHFHHCHLFSVHVGQ